MSLKEKMTAIADAIRAKTGKTGALTLDGMAREIAGITTGGAWFASGASAALKETERGVGTAGLSIVFTSSASTWEEA